VGGGGKAGAAMVCTTQIEQQVIAARSYWEIWIVLVSRRRSFNDTLWNVACPYLCFQNSGQAFLSGIVPAFELKEHALLSQMRVNFYIKCRAALVSVQSCRKRRRKFLALRQSESWQWQLV